MEEQLPFFNEILKEYPRAMSKEQFRKVAHISKATALWLLQSRRVPCRDNKQKTCRYTIKTNDVIAYLQDRCIHPGRYMAKDGWYKTRSGYGKSRVTLKDELRSLKPEQIELLRLYFETMMADFNDLLTVEEIHGFLGYSQSMITRWCRRKTFKSFLISNRHLIPKLCFLDFLASPASFGIQSKSINHLLYIREFFAQNKIKYQK